jgi:hypothetical protein
MRVIIFIIVVIGLNSFRAQDLIVTIKDDSLNCKITKIKKDYIYFTYLNKNEVMNTLIFVDEVKYYQKNYFSTPAIPPDILKKSDTAYQKIRVGAFGGLSYMTGKISNSVPSFLVSYIEELKSGYHFGGEINYYISKNLGFGLRYSTFVSKNKFDKIIIFIDNVGNIRIGTLKNEIFINSICPVITGKADLLNNKMTLNSTFSMCFQNYSNQFTFTLNYNSNGFKLTGNTIGLLYDLGLDYKFVKNLSIGLRISYIFGAIDNFEYKDGQNTKKITLSNVKEDISRLNFSVVLSFIDYN